MSNQLLMKRRTTSISRGPRPDYFRITPIEGPCTITPMFVTAWDLFGGLLSENMFYTSYDGGDIPAQTINNLIKQHFQYNIQYAINSGSFHDVELYQDINLNSGDYVEFRRNPEAGVSTTLCIDAFHLENYIPEHYYFLSAGLITFRPDVPYVVNGNIMSLLDGNCQSRTISDFAFSSLFYYDTNLVSFNETISIDYIINKPIIIDSLPREGNEFNEMFYGCSSLVHAPVVNSPYSVYTFDGMFYDCSLVERYDFAAICESGEVFFNNASAKSLVVRAAIPPAIGDSTITGLAADCVIYVPAASVDAYKAKQYWSARAAYIQAIPG